MTSSESDDQPTSRKRSRTSASSEDASAAGKKARGRPRVDTQDETAADVSETFVQEIPYYCIWEKRRVFLWWRDGAKQSQYVQARRFFAGASKYNWILLIKH